MPSISAVAGAEKRGVPGLFIGALIALAVLPLVEGICPSLPGAQVVARPSDLPTGGGLLFGLTLGAFLGLLGASILGWFRGRWARVATTVSSGVGVGSILSMPFGFSRMKGSGTVPGPAFYVALILGGVGFVINLVRTIQARHRPGDTGPPGGPDAHGPPPDTPG